MSKLAREESGFTLVELVVAMGIMILVLSATLGVLDTFGSTTQRNQKLTEAQERARLAITTAARELRNGSAYATDTTSEPSAVVRAAPWDLVYQTVNPKAGGAGNQNTLNLMRVRYCLNTLTSTFWRQTQTWTTLAAPAVIADTACPSTSWGSRSVVADDVVNGGTRRVFTFNSGNANDPNEASPALADISSVRMALWVDVNPGKAPAETQLATGAFLRNKNRRPVAECAAAPTGNNHVSLNGSRSTDPEGGMLSFAWADGGTPISTPGSLIDYKAPTTGAHTFTVTVTDPGGLSSSTTCTATLV